MGRLVCTVFIAALLFPYVAPHAQGGPETAFEENCVVCHDNPVARAPRRQALHAMSPDFIVEALSNGGLMQAPGSNLSQEQRVAVAEFLTGRKLGSDVPMSGRCASAAAPLTLDGPSYNGWGAGLENWRFQRNPGLNPADLRRLSVKWAFGFPGAVVAFGQPTVVDGRIFPGPSLAAKAAARQRSSVAVLMPIFCETAASDELSGGSKRATTASLNFCPYRAMRIFQRPQKDRPYPGGNWSDTEGRVPG